MISVTTSFGQKNWNAYTTLGINRIGVLYELGTNYNIKGHSVQLGLRFYEPDIVFEKDFPGVNLGYYYTTRKAHKMRVLLGAGLSFFYENKVTTNLGLFDLKFLVGPKWKLSDKLELQLTAGLGSVMNRVETSYAQNIETFSYINYELALGLTYRFWSNTDQ